MKDLKSAFSLIKENIYEYARLNDLLFQSLDFDDWNLMLKERSEKIRKIYIENEKAISFIKASMESLDDDKALEIFTGLKEFKYEEIHDAGFTIPIMEKLLSYFEKKGNKSFLLFLYLNYGYEVMEYYLRMGNQKFMDKARDAFLHVIALKDSYKEFKADVRARMFIGYYNLTSALPDLIEKDRVSPCIYYKEMLDFYFSKDIQEFDKDNEYAKDEVLYVVEAFCYGFAKYIDKDAPYRDEFFSLVERSLELFDDLSSDIVRVVNIILGYYHNQYDMKELFTLLEEMNKEYLDMNLTYSGTEDSIMEFCNWMDVTSSLTEIVKRMDMDSDKKKEYILSIQAPILNYISNVNYKDYTSYFDDVSSDIFKTLLPCVDSLDAKVDLIQRLIIRRQPITYIHSLMVKRISEEITFAILRMNKSILNPLFDLGMGGADILDYIGIGAMIHDLGKCLTVGVINAQSRKLTEDEFACIRLHPRRALDFLGDDPDFIPFYDIMLGHHKWYDGKMGYPMDFDNTKSKYKIAIDIISIADSIDAATDILGRNYTLGKDFDSLLKELEDGAGVRYNPNIVKLISKDEVLKSKLRYLTKYGRERVYYEAYKEIAKK